MPGERASAGWLARPGSVQGDLRIADDPGGARDLAADEVGIGGRRPGPDIRTQPRKLLLHRRLGRASARLHRTQPALTTRIRRLEADCGAALFEKAGRGIRLTAAGKVLLKWAQRMRFDLEDAQRELQAIGMLPTLIVQTGLLSFISRHHLQGRSRIPGLKEVPVQGATMQRRLVVTYRANSFLSPAAQRLLTLFEQARVSA